MQKKLLDKLSHGGISKTLQPSLQIFLFFEFLRTVATLECEVCSDNGTNCIGNLQTCDDSQHNTCVIIWIRSTLGDTVMQTVAKGCDSKEVCKTPKSHLNMGHGKILQASLVCCTEDACHTAKPQLPPREAKLNGKQCLACYSVAGVCSEEMVNCTGSEKYCFEIFSRTYADGVLWDSAMTGCTTKSTCRSINRGEMSILQDRDTVIKTSRCFRAASKGVYLWKFFPLLFAGFLFAQAFF
ncbi:phospholipase A2 inhibitor gamma subunit B-like [Candoia aspera]|uniref:phospholipase A2 inhibitor gamma subunit B-like n=1 Tax=Candoia aspera TaxID=51853 RepID=UPI002FD80984